MNAETVLRLRPAVQDDLMLLYEWANDPLVRNNSFHSDPIALETHEQWFQRMMANPRIRQYILLADDTAAGQVRVEFSAQGQEALISYSIAAPYRGKGYAKAMIRLLEELVQKEFPGVRRLVAQVKEDNEASSRVFLGSGYKIKCLVYEREL